MLENFGKLENDIHRCSAVLEKYQILWASRTHARSAALLVQSELEYLLFLLRSLYDVLQAIVQAIAAKLVLLDGSGRPALKNLPKSFREVVMKDRELRSLDEIQSRWNMPRPLAEWYLGEAVFFRMLRTLRDGIAHHGANPPTVFETEWGFAIAPDAAPWKHVEALLPGERWNGRLASLQALFAEFVLRGIRSTESFAETMQSFVHLPEALCGDVRLFLRSPFGSGLVSLENIRQQPWESRVGAG